MPGPTRGFALPPEAQRIAEERCRAKSKDCLTMRLHDIVRSLESADSDREVIVGQDRRMTIGHVISLSAAIEAELTPGDRVACVSDTFPIAMAAVLAVFRVHGQIALLSPVDSDIGEMVARFDATKVVRNSLGAEEGNGDGSLAERIAGGKTVVARDFGSVEISMLATSTPPDPHRMCGLVLATSGTEGRPKLVLHTEAGVIRGYKLVRSIWFEMLTRQIISRIRYNEEETEESIPWFGNSSNLGFSMTYLVGMPVSTVGGWSAGVQALLSGGTLLERPMYRPEDVIRAMRYHSVTNLVLPPITAQRIVRCVKRQPQDLPPLLVVGLGGNAVPPGLPREVEETLNCRVVSGYGSTELGGVVATTRFDDPEEERWSTIGRAVPGVELRTLGTGELQVKSPGLAAGYISAGGEVMSARMDDGWYSTGDVVAPLKGNRYRYVGRQSQVIVRGGRKMQAEVIEAILAEHPAVGDCAVVGVPSRVAGEEDVVAMVVAKGEVSRSTLRRRCIDRLGPGWSPRRVVWVDEIPTSQAGKRDLAEIRSRVSRSWT